MPRIAIKRIYEPAAPDDGFRVLVDRLWPRGMAKARANIDLWAKDVAPSNELRVWFGHDPARWTGFQERYRAELAQQSAALHDLLREAGDHAVTLLFATRDTEHNEAVVLRDVLTGMDA